jgi:polyhydroxyalkanoate synthesis regulator phasin
MKNSGAKYEELNAMVTNIKEQLKEGSINIEEAKKLLEIVYREYQSLEEEETNSEVNEMTEILISRWLSTS